MVGSAPPTAKIETTTTDPGAPCAWLDGRWDWVSQTWQWTPGGWVVPPKNCYFAAPEARWVPATGQGLLFYLPGRWYPDSGTAGCAVPRTCGPVAERAH